MVDAAAALSIDEAIAEARRLLQKPRPKSVSAWGGVGAAFFAALAALLLAGAVILGPGAIVGGPHADKALSHWQP